MKRPLADAPAVLNAAGAGVLDGKLMHRESFEWVESLRALGVPVPVSLSYARVVEGLCERLLAEYPNLKLRFLFKAVTAGLFAGGQPLFSRGLDQIHLLPAMSQKEVSGVVGRGVALLLSDAPRLFDQVSSALVAHEAADAAVNRAVDQLQLLLIQQQQVLQKHYPATGEGSLSTELLGTRIYQEDLSDDFLAKLYGGLNELLTAITVSGHWLPVWDRLMYIPMTFIQTRTLFQEVGELLGVLDDEANGELKRLYYLRWAGLDGRVLAHLEPRFSWVPAR
jgi:hypothetical protein